MATRRAALALLAAVFAFVAAPAAADSRHGVPSVSISAESGGTRIALRYGVGASSHVHFLHAGEVLEQVALSDVDNDGHLDILAVPRDGEVMVWHNAGHGRFARAAAPHETRHPISHGPRLGRTEKPDDGWQWGDNRHDAAMPRAPAVTGDVPVVAIRVTTPDYVRPTAFRRFSGRAPPVL